MPVLATAHSCGRQSKFSYQFFLASNKILPQDSTIRHLFDTAAVYSYLDTRYIGNNNRRMQERN